MAYFVANVQHTPMAALTHTDGLALRFPTLDRAHRAALFAFALTKENHAALTDTSLFLVLDRKTAPWLKETE